MKKTTQQLKNELSKIFPFEGYINGAVDSYGTIVETVSSVLEPGSTVLDFGSGPCDKVAMLQMLGYNCYACDDLSDEWHTTENNRDKIIQFTKDIGINFTLLDGNELHYEENVFDMVMLHDVLEHLHDSPRELLNTLIGYIKPGGYLYITVPNAGNIRKRLALLSGGTNLPRFETYYWGKGPWRGHIREYVHDDLGKLAEYLQLEIVDLSSVSHMIARLPGIVRPIYSLLTSIFPGWRDTWSLLAKKPQNWQPRNELPSDEMKAIQKLVSPYNH
jgi:SAM-dependent methyltransferase